MKFRHKVFLAMIILIGIYSYISIALPIDRALLQRYHISASKAQVLMSTIVIPFALIWLINAFGFVKLSEYAYLIRNNQDGQAFRQIASGLGILAFRMPIASTISSWFSYYSRLHPASLAMPIILINYFNIITAIIGFTFICRGAFQLLGLTGKSPPLIHNVLQSASVAALMLAYGYLALSNPGRSHPVNGVRAVFYLPDWLIILTIILPYMYVWYKGLAAALFVYFYQRNVAGRVYRWALRLLSWGIGAILLSSMGIQFLTAQGNRINRLSLGPLLMLVYGMLIGIAVGSLLVASGARKLRQIEEV